jgi:hypothetical protein
MPHRIDTESNGLGVVISFSGDVSGAEVVALNIHLISEQSFPQWRYHVWDFSKATGLGLTADDLRNISVQDITASAINPNLKTAIVGQPELFANRDKIFLVFEEVWTTYRPRFFTDFETARAWAAGDG